MFSVGDKVKVVTTNTNRTSQVGVVSAVSDNDAAHVTFSDSTELFYYNSELEHHSESGLETYLTRAVAWLGVHRPDYDITDITYIAEWLKEQA